MYVYMLIVPVNIFNIYTLCLYIYLINIHSTQLHILYKQKLFNAINHCPALVFLFMFLSNSMEQ